ncbi:hypothetical protein ABEB36_004205 [Hypothenemus hampei]|uniref:Uncharacterized protein n=1 Tax=Hypothenemus hampei TaxID=57062 RepID=A0ABD1F6C2_HYPHA
MWNQIVFFTLLQFLLISSRSLEPLEGPLWLDRFNDVFRKSSLTDDAKFDDNTPYYDNLRESDISFKEKRTFLSSSEKRALSMFARWGPINSFGKDRNPIRSGYPSKSFDSISAQTRSRMLGQPLRWG